MSDLSSRYAETIAGLAKPVLDDMGLSIWGVEVAGNVVRIFVEAVDAKEGEGPEAHGVDVGLLAKASRHISLILDVEDPFPGRYVLELSSPGIERPFFSLEQMRPYVGQHVEVKLTDSFDPLTGRKSYKGRFVKALDHSVVVEVDGEEHEIDFGLVKKARLVVTDWSGFTRRKR